MFQDKINVNSSCFKSSSLDDLNATVRDVGVVQADPQHDRLHGVVRIALVVHVPVGRGRPGLLHQHVVVVHVDAGALPGLRGNLPQRRVQHERAHPVRGLPEVDALHEDLPVVAALLALRLLVVVRTNVGPHGVALLRRPGELHADGVVHGAAPGVQLGGWQQLRAAQHRKACQSAPAVVRGSRLRRQAAGSSGSLSERLRQESMIERLHQSAQQQLPRLADSGAGGGGLSSTPCR